MYLSMLMALPPRYVCLCVLMERLDYPISLILPHGYSEGGDQIDEQYGRPACVKTGVTV